MPNFKLIFASNMALILNLETATTNCSVSIAKDGDLLAVKEHDTPNYSHSEQLHVFIQEVLDKTAVSISDLDAIAVSKGPGSYTGLRIGVSAAKGLCFSLDIPLISIPTLESMANRAKNKDADFIIPLLDARRMEVYSCVYDAHLNEVRETKAEIIDADSFQEFSEKGNVLLVGSGAEKCREFLSHKFRFDTSLVPSASEMVALSEKKFEAQQFEDVAYFEPFYLKNFVSTQKKS